MWNHPLGTLGFPITDLFTRRHQLRNFHFKRIQDATTKESPFFQNESVYKCLYPLWRWSLRQL